MIKKVLLAGILIIVFFAVVIPVIYNFNGILFRNTPWLMAGATAMGILSGIFRGIRNNAGSHLQPDRHTIDSFLEHWGTVSGILILVISGFFLKFGYRRIFSSNLHFLGLVVTLFFGSYFVADFFVKKKFSYLLPNIADIIDGTIKKYIFRKRWQDTGKYLSTQKSAFLVFSVLGIFIIISGMIKVVGYYYSVSPVLVHTATQIHDLFMILFVVMFLVHVLFAVAVRLHRRLLISFFTGKNGIEDQADRNEKSN
jgi:cytochrome b subunit of formate dehydrogenase